MADIKNVYCLDFKIKSGEDSESSSVTLYPGGIVSEVKIDGKSYSLSLNSLDFSKRAYEPCHVRADIKIAMSGETGELPALQKTVDYFASFSSVTLKIVSIEKGGNGPGRHSSKLLKEVGKLGEKYVIVDTQPTYRTGGGSTAMSVNLDIYSPDHFFTRRVYSKTYTGQKLGSIIDDAVGTFGLGKMMSVMHKYQNFLTYENAQKKDSSGNAIQEEFIQPYLVQYNESFYELIARTANRCGEWLYFEDGTLYLGWKNKSKDLTPTKLGANQFQSAVFRSRRKEETEAAITSVNRDPIQGDATKPGTWNYNMEVPANEYLTPLTKDGFDSSDGWWDVQKNMWAQFASKMLSCTSLYQGIIDFGFDAAKLAAQYAQRASKGNKDANDKYFKTVDEKNLEHYNANGSDAKSTTPFSTYPGTPALGSVTRNVNADLYQIIRNAQLELERKSLDLELGGNLMNLQVGSLISIPSIAGENALYMICEVTGADAVAGDARAETMSVRAVPVDKSKAAMFPLARKADLFPKSEQQLGYITDKDDPLRLNRVRVRFSWEPSGCESPWIRMATPYASKDGAGVYYTPQKGDEVILQFYNGNMERPVVVGSLFNKDNKPIYGKRSYGWVFRTPGGHLIRAADSTEFGNFMGGILPILGFARSFVPGLLPMKVDDNSKAKKLLGQMEITDEYGMYNIELSSAKRLVSISSPFGDVKIDAYSGITINAPNGDVKIVGKNVEIVANNNLTLTSGQNLKNKSINALARGKISGKDIAKEVGKSILYDNILKKCLDLGLLRTVFETFVKPIEGTLTIKSHRFVKLEAGLGAAHIPSSAYKRPSKGAFGKREITLRKLSDTIVAIKSYTGTLLNTYREKYQNIHAQKDQLNLPPNYTITMANILQKAHGDNLELYKEDQIRNGYPENERANVPVRDVKALMNRINAFMTLVNEFDKRDFKPSVLSNVSEETCLVKKMDELFGTVDNNYAYKKVLRKNDNESFDDDAPLSEDDEATFKRTYERMFIVNLLNACSADAGIKFTGDNDLDVNAVQGKFKKGEEDFGDKSADERWNKLISLVVRDAAIADTKDTTKQDPQGNLVQILGNIPFVKASERNFYKADNSGGRILMSDTNNGRTVQIENGALVEHDNAGYEEVLKKLKEICSVAVNGAGPVIAQDDQHDNEENIVEDDAE